MSLSKASDAILPETSNLNIGKDEGNDLNLDEENENKTFEIVQKRKGKEIQSKENIDENLEINGNNEINNEPVVGLSRKQKQTRRRNARNRNLNFYRNESKIIYLKI